MRQHITRWVLLFGTGLSCLLASAAAISSVEGARLIGLAMHQNTGRNIYIGALHYDDQIPRPDNLVSAPGPKSMEYRVVARRTSIRSLMGSILLQGELASGTPPSASTTLFVEDIMGAVQGSLYAGDSLQIRLNKDGSIVAILDEHELAHSEDREVSDYLLMGWVGEGGPSTAFRTSILAPEINGSLLPIYNAHTVSADRIAAIGSWTPSADAAENELVPVTKTTTVASAAPPTPESQTAVAASPKESIAQAQPTAPASSEDTLASKKAQELETKAKTVEPVVLASVTPSREMIQPAMEEPKVADVINAMEYSQRLASFNTYVLRSVYAQIRYPKSAIRRNIQGTLELDLRVTKAGELQEVSIAVSSGHTLLDKWAVKAANKAFSDLPLKNIDQVAISEYSEDGDELIIPIPVSFILTE